MTSSTAHQDSKDESANTKSRPHVHISITPEPHPASRTSLKNGDDPDLSRSLDDFKYARLETELKTLQQQLLENTELHGIRKKHAFGLFLLTICWVCVIWLIVLLQGFSQWFLPFPVPDDTEYYLRFKLSDTVMVGFITSTTATVLGLYGIAAYWLYSNKKKHDDQISKEARGKK